MPTLRDIMTSEELERMEQIQKKMEEAQTPLRVKELDSQLQDLINQAKERFARLSIPNPLKVKQVLKESDLKDFHDFLQSLTNETDFNEVVSKTEALLQLLKGAERRFYQDLIKQGSG